MDMFAEIHLELFVSSQVSSFGLLSNMLHVVPFICVGCSLLPLNLILYSFQVWGALIFNFE